MMSTPTRRTLWFLTACLGVLGAVLLVIDHWAHVFGVLPYVLLLACPLMHLLHRGHGSHSPPQRGAGPRP
jgi:hypothetical protein